MASAKQRYYDNQAKKGVITTDQAKTMGASLNAPASSSKVNNMDEAKSFINSNQTIDANSKKLTNEPEIRASVKGYNDIVDSLTGTKMADIKSPDVPNYESSYLGLRNDYGVTALETSMNDLNAEADAIKTQLYVNKNAEAAKGGMVPQNVVEGRVGEHEKAANERLMILDDQVQAVTGQLNTAYNVVNTLMNYKSMDYNTAKADYDTKFSQNMQMFNVVKGIDDSIKTDKEHQQAVATSNLNIMYGAIKANPSGASSLTSSQKTQITKLEVQAGLPPGFYNTIQGTPLATNLKTDKNGNNYAEVLTRDAAGNLKVETKYTGISGGDSGSGSSSDSMKITQSDIITVKAGFESKKGKDGKIDPALWNSIASSWSSPTDFYSRFSNYVNPDRAGEYLGYSNSRTPFN